MRFAAVLIIFLPICCLSQSRWKKGEANVLSYYAVTNSIDGQPFIDQRNLLRFYPVFALRDSVLAVKVTIYYGNEIFIDNGTRFTDGLYWEVKLPKFKLGDAIQRYEVETRIKFNTKSIKKEIANYKNGVITKEKILGDSLEKIKSSLGHFNALSQMLSDCFLELTRVTQGNEGRFALLRESLEPGVDASNQLINEVYALKENFKNMPDSASGRLEIIEEGLRNLIIQIRKLKSVIDSTKQDNLKNQSMFQNVAVEVKKIQDKINTKSTDLFGIDQKLNAVAKYIAIQEKVIDTLKQALIKKLNDREFSGSGIQRSDIIFEKNDSVAKVLYRNYRDQNRKLVVLDPAEKLSIFKIRYVPFPVVGSSLAGPNQDGVPIVFEVGLTFGNQVITSNEFYKPSIQRLGVAVALSPKLFAKDAKILALLFTYDFNTYASIGVGANFGTGVNSDPNTPNPPSKLEPYFSFGINQKAFQRLVVGIANIFR